jgi:HEAT repeat protein
LTTPKELLERVNSSDFEALHRSRWSPEAAQETVSALAALLTDPDPKLVADALRALHRVGPDALPAAQAIAATFAHADPVVRRVAISTLARVCVERPSEAIPSLIQATEHPELLEDVLVALVAFGSAASAAVPLYCRAYNNKTTKLRRLAIRGLVACHASDTDSLLVLRKASSDASAEVRKEAERGRRS